jgi:hypothetical protein
MLNIASDSCKPYLYGKDEQLKIMLLLDVDSWAILL